VYQVQYTAWPDQGLPSSTKSFNTILDIVDIRNATKNPVLVHCSAGIGRTGVFFAVHDNVQKMRHILVSQIASPSLNFSVPSTVRYMRQNRAGCVQTKEQYAFIYMSLKEKIEQYLSLLAYKNEG
jgi:protein tyrosine phosphatase